MNGYRKEYKYIVDDALLREVENRIGAIMVKDSHQKGDFYRIRSIYLDSPEYACYMENLAGISTREKYRIRIYDGSDAKISAEIKVRHRDTISKMSGDISKQTLDAIINRDAAEISRLIREDMTKPVNEPIFKQRALEKYLVKLLGDGFGPAAMVNYERSAYVYDVCNVRITFDRNIETTVNYAGFFDERLEGLPVIEKGKHVLEVKFDEFLPDVIMEALAGVLPARSSCSKYAKSINALNIKI